MRFFGEYAFYLIAMVVTIVVFVKPVTKQHWPVGVRIAFYAFSAILFLSVVLLEYFTKTNLADVVRQAIGNTVCGFLHLEACPKEFHENAERAIESKRPPPSTFRRPPSATPNLSEKYQGAPPGASDLLEKYQGAPPTYAIPPPAMYKSACNEVRDEATCKADKTCSWVAALVDAKIGIQKRRAYCRTKPTPKAKAPQAKDPKK
jgi:hypothetical protein